jgi:hypothetical protein
VPNTGERAMFFTSHPPTYLPKLDDRGLKKKEQRIEYTLQTRLQSDEQTGTILFFSLKNYLLSVIKIGICKVTFAPTIYGVFLTCNNGI